MSAIGVPLSAKHPDIRSFHRGLLCQSHKPDRERVDTVRLIAACVFGVAAHEGDPVPFATGL
jgi:hypothetical protein